ncbi:hypothetical protein HID58_064285 [Brassica napus]|uniref:Uncharacterized protein n=1 Tax=Brassica napus TaxID=3708 RepID=A0ABQ7Z9W5_BRANA|nr:hypothetical protein HID58_064285 [Brassica napus]
MYDVCMQSYVPCMEILRIWVAILVSGEQEFRQCKVLVSGRCGLLMHTTICSSGFCLRLLSPYEANLFSRSYKKCIAIGVNKEFMRMYMPMSVKTSKLILCLKTGMKDTRRRPFWDSQTKNKGPKRSEEQEVVPENISQVLPLVIIVTANLRRYGHGKSKHIGYHSRRLSDLSELSVNYLEVCEEHVDASEGSHTRVTPLRNQFRTKANVPMVNLGIGTPNFLNKTSKKRHDRNVERIAISILGRGYSQNDIAVGPESNFSQAPCEFNIICGDISQNILVPMSVLFTWPFHISLCQVASCASILEQILSMKILCFLKSKRELRRPVAIPRPIKQQLMISLEDKTSAVTEPTSQSDVPTSATTDHPGATSAQLAAMTISDHPANTSTPVATTSDKPSMLATSDHQANTSTLVATTSKKPSMLATSDHQANTSTQPFMVATSALPAAVTISLHPAGTMSNTKTMYSTQPDISLIFQTLLGRIDELARGTTSRLEDLAHSQIICNNRINELQSVEIGAPRSQQVDITPRLQRVLFNDVPTPATGPGQHRSIQANDLHAPIASSGQQHQTHEWLLNKYHNYRDSSSKNQQNEKPTAHALLNAGSLPTAHALLKS